MLFVYLVIFAGLAVFVYKRQRAQRPCIIAGQHAAAALLLALGVYIFALLLQLPAMLALLPALAMGGWYGAQSRRIAHSEAVLWTPIVTSGSVAIVISLLILSALLFDSIAFFGKYNFFSFLFGTVWSPQQVAAGITTNVLGCVPLLLGSVLIALIAMLVAVPLGILTAVWLNEYAPRMVRGPLRAVIQTIAGIPSVVFGFFAALVVAPLLQNAGSLVVLTISSESALTAGLVIGWMVTPYTITLTSEALRAVPVGMRDASMALGATKAETICRTILPSAFAGIAAGVLLSFSRAIGETMVVVMAAGLVGRMSFNPLDSVTTITVQITSLLTGDQEFDSPKTLAAFALGLLLFVLTMLVNAVALRLVKRYGNTGERL